MSKDKTYTFFFPREEGPNKNGRFYPKEMMDKAIEEFMEKRVKTKKALGTTPESMNDNFSEDGGSINLLDVTNLVTDMKIRDDGYTLDIKGIKVGEAMLESGSFFPVPCGIGKIADDGTTITEYHISCYGLTLEPAIEVKRIDEDEE